MVTKCPDCKEFMFFDFKTKTMVCFECQVEVEHPELVQFFDSYQEFYDKNKPRRGSKPRSTSGIKAAYDNLVLKRTDDIPVDWDAEFKIMEKEEKSK